MLDKITNLLADLKIDKEPVKKGDEYIIELETDVEFGKVYSLIETSVDNGILDPSDTPSTMNESEVNIVYNNDEVELQIHADLEAEQYVIKLKEM